jgi:hypothetical protein
MSFFISSGCISFLHKYGCPAKEGGAGRKVVAMPLSANAAKITGKKASDNYPGFAESARHTSGRLELFFADSAHGACPVVRQFVKGQIVVFGRIVLKTAHLAHVFFHGNLLVSSGCIGFPQAVQIAVGARGDGGGFGAETGLRGIARLELLHTVSVVGQQFYPFNVMFFFHRVGNASHADLEAVTGFFDDRHMLFPGRVHSAGLNGRHGLSATGEFPAAAVEDFHNIAAMCTFIDFGVCCHRTSFDMRFL